MGRVLQILGLHMLPNLKFMMCGVLFCFLLFAVTGAGVMLPDSRTHVGETPEIGRPMMQRSIAGVPAQSQFYRMTVARRDDELEQLRERASSEIAGGAQQPPAMAEVRAEASPGYGAEPPAQVSAAETRSDDRADEADPPQVAVLSPPAAEDSQPSPRLVNVPLPPPRPAAFFSSGLHRQVRMFHHKRRAALQHDTAAQGSGQSGAASQGMATGYTPP
jgi:hypothetical protein